MSQKQAVPILHIIKSLGRGGAETLLPETLNKHDKEKYQFHYIYFIPWKNQMVNAIEMAGGKVTCFSASNNLKIMSQVFRIVSYVRKNKIRLIHCHLPWAGIVGRIVGKITNVPVVYTEHNVWERYHKLTYHLNKLSFSSQKKVIAVSEDVAKSIKTHRRSPKPDIQVVLNGINTDKFVRSFPTGNDIRKELGIPEDAIVIGTACVFRSQKRLTTWIEVASQLHKRHPDVHFIIAGDGVLKNEVFEKVKQLKTESFTHFPGLQTEIRPYFKQMDVFMMTSEFEGLPIALLEAMSMECMPACTDAGGIRELLINDKNGILVPVGEPYQLVDRLSEYIKSPARIKEMGKAARRRVVDDFSMEKMVGELETIYDELLN